MSIGALPGHMPDGPQQGIGGRSGGPTLARRPEADRSPDQVLLKRAATERSDLDVTGASGRRRTRQFGVGGVTRPLLGEARLPGLPIQ